MLGMFVFFSHALIFDCLNFIAFVNFRKNYSLCNVEYDKYRVRVSKFLEKFLSIIKVDSRAKKVLSLDFYEVDCLINMAYDL